MKEQSAKDKKDAILSYCAAQKEPVTAKTVVKALYPGKFQSYINLTITELVQENKLVRIDTHPYLICLPELAKNLSDPEIHPKRPVTHKRRKMVANVPHPCPEEADKYIRAWDEQESYRLQESALNELFFNLCPENKRIEDILVKIATLNDFYSTNIFSVFPVAKRILSLKIDDRLNSGDLTLVNDIANVKMTDGAEKTFYSFATKYCSHHRPKQYAIYDSYVDRILRYFRDTDHFADFDNGDLKEYAKFNAVLRQFQDYYGLQKYDLKMLDRYLWQLGKVTFPRSYKAKKSINKQEKG